MKITQKEEKKIEKTIHKPVLLDEVIKKLDLESGDIVFDGTLGGGGYAEEILTWIKEKGILIGTDLDSKALKRVNDRLIKFIKKHNWKKQNFFLFQKNYSEINEILLKLKQENKLFDNKINKAVLDLGFSSDQLKYAGRGISFQNLNEDLDMNLSDNNKNKNITAKEILNFWSEESIADVIYYYGGERGARKIAKAIVKKRKKEGFVFEKVKDLVELIELEVGKFYKFKKIHPATKTFQALRITVNDEIENLKRSIENIFNSLEVGGIFAIVSFHSLEDKVVKNVFRDLEDQGLAKRVNKKVILPSLKEEQENPRARSAKLRVIIKK